MIDYADSTSQNTAWTEVPDRLNGRESDHVALRLKAAVNVEDTKTRGLSTFTPALQISTRDSPCKRSYRAGQKRRAARGALPVRNVTWV